ncbi:MAG: hypothetical protein LW806_03240 [Planctomycetaceae bacterium]|nr:hypothetical protein [Planctomycetaceae bacterium]
MATSWPTASKSRSVATTRSDRVSGSGTIAMRFARSPGAPPAGVMRAIAPVTTEASDVGSLEAGSLMARTREPSPGSAFEACSTSLSARSISRCEPRRTSEFVSRSTATVTPCSAFASSSVFEPGTASGACSDGGTAVDGTCANAAVTNARRAGSAGGQVGEAAGTLAANAARSTPGLPNDPSGSARD